MTKKKKTTPTIPESTFVKAFIKHFKCKPEDVEIRMITEGQVAFLVHKELGYKISTRDALWDDVAFQLNDIDAAQSINLSIWIIVTQNTISIKGFLPKLRDKLENAEEAHLLHLALSINSFSEDQYGTFWKTLERIDKHGTLFGKAIVSATEVNNGDGLIDDMTELMIENGLSEYNMYVGGIFERVYVANSQNAVFYIYSADHVFIL